MSSERLSPTSYIVLGLVDRLGEATPYDLKRAVGASLGNFWSIPHAQVYAEPERLAATGFLSERRESEGRRRRHYKLNAKGRKALADWLAEPTAQMAELRDPGMLKLFFGGDAKSLAAAQLPPHREKLAEYEGLAEQLEGKATAGSMLALRAGIGHEREWIRFWEAIERGKTP